MTFDELKKITFDSADNTVDYLIVYHSQDTQYSDRYRRGSILRQSYKGCSNIFVHVRDSSLVISTKARGDRLVVTTGMKRSIKDGWGNRPLGRALAKCFYPLAVGSPYYSDEELFEAKLTDDYSAILDKVRTEYMLWKKHQ